MDVPDSRAGYMVIAFSMECHITASKCGGLAGLVVGNKVSHN